MVPSRELAARIARALADACRSPATTAARSPSAGASTTARGEVGFISSVTQPFCGACTRARISSEGRFYTCLFATEGLDLRARCAAARPTPSCWS